MKVPIGSFGYTSKEITYAWKNSDAIVVEELSLMDYVLDDRWTGEKLIGNRWLPRHKYICYPARSVATVTLVFSRTLGYYFLRTYFPLIIFVFW